MLPRSILRDAHFALRGFRRAPAFVATVVLTIALALGLNTTVFTIFDAYVLRPAAVRDPFSLFALSWVDRAGHEHGLAWREFEQARSLPVASASFAYRQFFARVDGRPLFGVAATGDALQVLGATAALGRTLVPDDAALPIGAPVVVLSYDTWRGRFGADSAIVGRTVLVRGAPLTVVGVLAKGFGGVSALPPDFWVPVTALGRLGLEPNLFGPSGPPVLRGVLRLRPGVDPAQARVALGRFADAITRDNPDSLRAIGAELTPLASALPRNQETIALFAPVVAAFGLVLLIACANVMNVMLARAVARQREIGVRLALGAGRARLVRQLLTECALLALPAAALGFALSRWTIDAGVRAMFASMPPEFVPYVRVVPLAPDLRVFAFLLAAALASALAFGLVPALQATRPVSRAARGDRLRNALVVGQITVCALLLITTGVLLRGAERARRAETGMRNTAHVVQVELDDRWRAASLARLRRDPDVLEVAASSAPPLDGSFPLTTVRAAEGTRVESAAYNYVSPGYFPLLGVPLARGRAFTDAEARDGAAVAIVSESTARRLWPGRDALGMSLRVEGPRARTVQVVGVARDAVSGWIGTGLTRPVAYFPASADAPSMNVLARVSGVASRARDRIDRELGAAQPGAVEQIHTMDDFLAVQLYPFRAFSWVSTALGAVALVLTVLGVYGVLSYLVAQRTREIGIRMALGAAVRDTVGAVVGQSLRLAAVGVAVGAVLAVGASRLLESMLVVVRTFDVAGYGGGVVVVLLSCLAAAYAPARRAARVEPTEALRAE